MGRRSEHERNIRIAEHRKAVTWLHARAESMRDPHAKAVLNLAADEYGRSRLKDRQEPKE